MVKASGMTFGVEFEVQIPNDYQEIVTIGGYHRGDTQDWLPPGWNVQADGSLEADQGFFTCEVVSPVLKGEEGLFEVVFVCDVLTEMGAKVNNSMGMHVHVGAADIKSEQIAHLKQNFSVMERFLYDINGEMADVRYNNRNYRQPINGVRPDYCKPSTRWDSASDQTDRYRSLNLTNYYTKPNKKTVEFRLWRPTVNATMAVAAIYASVGLVVNTLNKGVIKVDGQDREEVLRALFTSKEIDRIVDDECWDVLLYMARNQKKSTIR